jgi:hypothetical protein
MKLTTDETKARCTMLTTYCLKTVRLACTLTYTSSTADCSLLYYTPVSPQ